MDRLLPWLRRSGWAYVAVAVALGLLAWRLGPGAGGDGGGQPEARAGTGPVAVSAPAGGRGMLVHVAGEVRRPGVYRVRPGSRVQAAVRRAGGPTRRADLAGLNLAAALQDGQQVVIPRRAPAGSPAPAGGAAPAGPVSLSSATEADLERLDGIGPTLAGRIVEWRRAHGGFASIDQLLEVPGIGPTRLESLRAHVAP